LDILIVGLVILYYYLCVIDQLVDAVKPLKGIGRAGCVPNLKSYNTVIGDS